MRRAARSLVLGVFFWSAAGRAAAQPAPAAPVPAPKVRVKDLRVVVPAAQGQASYGTRELTRALRRTVAEGVAEVVPEEKLEAAMEALRIPKARRESREAVAAACQKIGVPFALVTNVVKRGWLYTARSVLVNCANAEIQMDFRSDYYKPSAETEDRGIRIAKKTLEKLEVLLERGVPLHGMGPEKPAGELPDVAVEPPPPDVVAELPDAGGEVGGFEPSFDENFDAAFGDLGVEAEFDGVEEEGWTWAIRGWLGISAFAYLHPDVADGVDRTFVKLGIRSTLTGKLGTRTRIRVLPLVELDLINRRLHRVVLEEGFLEQGFGPFELRVGWDSLTWGSASALNIVDVINARNFAEGVVDAPKIGQPMLALRYLFGNHSVSFLYLTPFVEPQLPRFGTVFNPLALPVPPDFVPPVVYGTEFEEWQPQAATRIALAFPGLDLRASYFYGYERFPLIHFPSGSAYFPLIHHVSTDGQLLIGGTAIKWELASVWHPKTANSERPPITNPNGQPAASILLPGQRFVWVAGIEHTFEGIIGDSTLIPLAEYVGTSDSELFTDVRPPDDAVQFFQNHVIYGFRWNFENSVGSELTVIDLMDVAHPSDHLVSVEYSERWFTHFTFTLGARWGFAQRGHKMAAFEQLSGVFTSLRLNY